MKRTTTSDNTKNISPDESMPGIAPAQENFFAVWLKLLTAAQIPFVVGGAFAVYVYTGIWRNTKDLDIFLKPQDLKSSLDILKANGFATEITDVRWLAKVFQQVGENSYFMDLIFGTRNKPAAVSDDWFSNSISSSLFGFTAPIIGVEELIASKAHIALRSRFDGGDIMHLIRSQEGRLNWQRLREIVPTHLLLWHLLLFEYIYPDSHTFVPTAVINELFNEVRVTRSQKKNRFGGLIIDYLSFAPDCLKWGYDDDTFGPLVTEEGAAV